MPRFSVCIPSYNNACYLDACVKSVLSQDFRDIELIVINDGSTDDTCMLLNRIASSDARVIAVNRADNRGLHRTRAEGVELATGDYTVFLDSDDEFLPGFLTKLDSALRANPVDLLHFGIKVEDCGVGTSEASQFESYINAPLEELTGEGIMRAVFSPGAGGYRQDWRFTQRAFATPLLKRAFDSMTGADLGRAEDAYESFVTLAMATRSVTRNDIVGLLYNYGRGVNSLLAFYRGLCRGCS